MKTMLFFANSVTVGITSLSYEIERWDSANRTAEIWVLLDTIHGNDSTRHIFIYTGNGRAPATSSGPDVFSAADAFTAVWHMGGDGDSSTGGYKDATGNQNHATGISMTAQSDTSCLVGLCPNFDGNEDYLIVPANESLDMGNTFSVMLWVKFDGGAPVNYPRILDRKSDYQDQNGWTIELGNYNDDRIGVQGSDSSGSKYDGYFTWSESNWEHIAFVFNDTTATLFANGIEKAVMPVSSVVDNDNDLYIGQYPGGGRHYWIGKMDEIRLSDTLRSAAWIKLSYENQKEGSTVVKKD